MSKLSINLLTLNAEKYLDACLESVRIQTFRDFQILVIDNNSQDKTREKIEEWQKIFESEGVAFKIIYNEKNLGFAEGHNIGLKFLISNFKFQNNEQISNFKSAKIGCLGEFQNTDLISGTGHGKPHPNPPLKGEGIKYVCCLNQDIIIRQDYFEKMVKFMDAHLDCGSASGKLMRITDDEIYTKLHETEHEIARMTSHNPSLVRSGTHIDYDMLAKECNIIDSAGLRIFKSQRVVEIGQGEEDNGQYDKTREVFGVSGAVPVYRMSALEDVKNPALILLHSAVAQGRLSKGRGKTHPLPLSRGEQYEYFDKDFENYKEDIDLAYRMRWRGWKSYVIPSAVAYHKRGAKQLSENASDLTAAFNRKNKSKYANYCSQRNQIWMLIKNLDKLNFYVLWYELKKFGYEFLFEWSTFKAWIDALKEIGVMIKKRRWIMRNRKVGKEEIETWYE